jgi:predicted DsbA family dithiol-disulfide isomerase
MKIEIYLNSEELMTKSSVNPYFRAFQGEVSNEYDDQLLLKQRIVELPDEVKKMKTILEDLALKHNIEMNEYDTIRIRDAVRAFFKGIHKTPTFLIGKQKLTGKITEDQIIKAFKEQFKV